MDWWDVAEQPTNYRKTINFLLDCKKGWDCGSEKSIDSIKNLEKHIKAIFIVENIRNWREMFDEASLDGVLEIEAIKVKLLDIDFSAGPLPLCKSGAYFILPITNKFRKVDLSQWQEANDQFHDAISFYWDFSDIEEIDIDLSFGSHSGVECALDNGNVT